MTGYRRNDMRLSPASPGWWMRLFVAGLFIFCFNYVPIHLVVETHLDDLPAPISGAAAVSLTSASLAHHDDREHHIPHLASDHLFRLAPQTASHVICLDLVTVGTGVASFTPQPRQRLFLTERQNPPGQSAPGPSQPRAPPTV